MGTTFRTTVLVGLLLCASAAAAPPGASLAKFEAGKKAFTAQHYEEALRAFEESHSLQQSPNTRLYIAHCHRALGHVGTAYVQYRLAAVEAEDRLGATQDRRFVATRDAARREFAALEAKVPRLTLAVPADVPERLSVKLDGAEVQRSVWGTALEVDPGPHRVEAGGPRIHPFVREVSIKEGEVQRIDLRPERIPTGRLELHFVQRPDGMAVTLDGTAVPPEQMRETRDLDVGVHIVVAQAPGYRTFRWRGDLADREALKLSVALRASGGTPRAAFYGVAGGAVAALAVGAGLRVWAESTQADELAKDPANRDPAVRDSVHNSGIAATVLFAAGGALAVTAGVLAFTTRWRDTDEARGRQAQVAILPWLGPSAGGVILAGSFVP